MWHENDVYAISAQVAVSLLCLSQIPDFTGIYAIVYKCAKPQIFKITFYLAAIHYLIHAKILTLWCVKKGYPDIIVHIVLI